jgi:hypothetical protein
MMEPASFASRSNFHLSEFSIASSMSKLLKAPVRIVVFGQPYFRWPRSGGVFRVD